MGCKGVKTHHDNTCGFSLMDFNLNMIVRTYAVGIPLFSVTIPGVTLHPNISCYRGILLSWILK